MAKEKDADAPAHHGRGMLSHAVQNHVDSFNGFLKYGLDSAVEQMQTLELEDPSGSGESLSFFISDLMINKPVCKSNTRSRNDAMFDKSELEFSRPWLPSDCRMAHATYSGALNGYVNVRCGGKSLQVMVAFGDIPIMVRSEKCNLHGMTSDQLVQAREDCTESGGYFLLHGLERVVRLLIMPRANFPMAVVRGSYKNRGKLYTDQAVVMRCMRPDGSTQTNCLHYLKDGSCNLRFSVGKEEWLIPLSVVCHCVCPVSDRFLIELLAGGSVQDAQPGDEPGGNQELWDQVVVMIQQQNKKQSISSQSDARRYLGKIFRVVVGNSVPQSFTEEQVGKYMADQFFMVHTDDPWQKLLSLCIMFQKLMGLVQGHIEPDNQDTMSSHEILHPGQLYGMILKEALEVNLLQIRAYIRKTCDVQGRGKRLKLSEYVRDPDLIRRAFGQSMEIQQRLENFLSTGNVTSRSGLDLMQVSGYTVVADKLNQARYSSHFAAVHRGQYFAEMKTTTVRKLLPETWGFLCPVHTPDGSPCGLLNHLAHSCRPVILPVHEDQRESVLKVLQGLGAQLWSGAGAPPETRNRHAWVLLDGRPVAFIERTRLHFAAEHLRNLKVQQRQGIPGNMEIVLSTRSWGKLYTGLFLFLGPGRLIRPVRHLQSGLVEWIGPMEQLFLNVSVLRKEKRVADEILDGGKKLAELPEQLPLRFTHEELEPTELFSTLAALTPFSNHNQSPRNMYQCQMLKQTMATPYHNHEFRPDNKVFRIYCPQSPLVRTQMYDKVHCDEHPIGTNAVVAVITYTGYDMEDAMIINKQSYERGFGHGIVYKTKIIDAAGKDAKEEEKACSYFANVRAERYGEVDERFCEELDDEGFPPIGTRLTAGMPLYCVVNAFGEHKISKYTDDEPCYVEQVVRLDGKEIAGSEPVKRALLKLRYTRNPVVGDKFSSRHGQKGVMSILWPGEDMPWSESGLTPDILFNPHGFPSRMTIGMLIESIAGKTASLEGKTAADATTFRGYTGFYNNGDNEAEPFKDNLQGGPTAAEYFGDTLMKHGYKRLGTERMYSGIHGTEIETDIFLGVVYYQRLRHLVLDKAQVRSRGNIDRLTNQPVKGRKRQGGIRFGEMERDSLLAHGTAFLLHDRLMRSSDYDMAYVCPSCGSVVTPTRNAGTDVMLQQGRSRHSEPGEPWECRPCSLTQQKIVRCQTMPVPWVFRYLACELASMNVKMDVKVSDRARHVSLQGSKYLKDKHLK